MGQHQLLPLGLSSIIVPLALLACLKAFLRYQTPANQDLLRQDAPPTFADATGRVAKSTHMSGVGNLNADTLAALHRDTSAASYNALNDPVTTTPNGECAIESQTTSTLTVAFESDVAAVTVSFKSGGDPEIQTTTVSVK